MVKQTEARMGSITAECIVAALCADIDELAASSRAYRFKTDVIQFNTEMSQLSNIHGLIQTTYRSTSESLAIRDAVIYKCILID